MNRAAPSVHRLNVAASDVKPTPSEDPRITPRIKDRRSSSTGLGFGLAYSGLTGIGGTMRIGFSSRAAGLAGALRAASALVIGPGFTGERAEARMLAVSLG